MLSLVIGHPNVFGEKKQTSSQIVTIGDRELHVGIIDIDEPVFDPKKCPFNVLLKKNAFSCNFRDRALSILLFDKCVNKSTTNDFVYCGFGSEFVANVIAVGDKVTSLKVGDRVIPDCGYPQLRKRVSPGIPSNFSSERFSVLDEEQLIRIPNELSDTMAASMTISGQTVYSILRRANPQPGESVLLTAASSNTSLFAMRALKNYQVNIVGLTSSVNKVGALESLGYDHVVLAPKIDPMPLQGLTNKFKGFDIVIDPYFDLYLDQVIDHMNYNSRYFTCGWYRQNGAFEESTLESKNYKTYSYLTKALLKNLSINGNCLGSRQDLQNAIIDVTNNKAQIIIDEVFSVANYPNYLEKAFQATNRIGKAVFCYES